MTLSAVLRSQRRHDVDDAKVHRANEPEEQAGDHGVAWPTVNRVLDWKSNAQVAFDANSCQEKCAGVNSRKEHKAGEGAQVHFHRPHHVINSLLHLEGQKGEEDEVGDCEVQEEDVDRGGFAMDLSAEGAEREDIGRKPDHEGKYVDRQKQLANQHDVEYRFHKAFVNSCKTVKRTRQMSLKTEEYNIAYIQLNHI